MLCQQFEIVSYISCNYFPGQSFLCLICYRIARSVFYEIDVLLKILQIKETLQQLCLFFFFRSSYLQKLKQQILWIIPWKTKSNSLCSHSNFLPRIFRIVFNGTDVKNCQRILCCILRNKLSTYKVAFSKSPSPEMNRYVYKATERSKNSKLVPTLVVFSSPVLLMYSPDYCALDRLLKRSHNIFLFSQKIIE